MAMYDKLSDPLAFIIFSLTLFLPIVVGFITLRKTKSQSDFFIGGRGMDKFVVALSAVSSGRSSWLVLALSGMAYKLGVGAVWAVIGYIIVEMFQFIYIGRKLRMQTGDFRSITLLDYFESRFDDRKQLIRIIGAVIMVLFLISYVAAQFNAGAKSLSTALDIPLIVSLIIAVVLILVYMVLGGYIAVAYNDVIRALIMLFGLAIFPLYGMIRIGGFHFLLESLKQLSPLLVDPFSLAFGVIIGFVGIGLGSPGQPHIVVRYMTIDDPDQLRFAAVVGTFWNVILAWGAIFIGLIGRVLIPNAGALPNEDPEVIYLVLSSQFFGPVLYGLMLGGIFAAILSTVDSQLLIVASTLVRDVYEKIIGKGTDMPEYQKLALSRIVVVFSGILALIMAYYAQDLIFWLVLFAWAGLGASFGPALIFSLYWKKTSRAGIIAGMLTGTIVTIIWKLYLKDPTGVYELIPAFLCSSLTIALFSSAMRKKRRPLYSMKDN